jgi:hypothetical protein
MQFHIVAISNIPILLNKSGRFICRFFPALHKCQKNQSGCDTTDGQQ